VALNAKEPVAEGVLGFDAGAALPAPIVTLEVDVGVPEHAPLLKNAYKTLPVTPVDGNPPVNEA